MNSPYDAFGENTNTKTEVKTMGKGLFKSKLSWLGILTTIVSIGTFFQGEQFITENPKIAGAAGTIVGIAVLLLRIFGTKEPITSLK